MRHEKKERSSSCKTLDISTNFKAYAQEIAGLLDQKESDEKTHGDGQIEASIWARYSGKPEGETEKVSIDDAVKIIMLDLMDRGVDFIRGVLHSIGIDWEPSVVSEPNENQGGLNVPISKLPRHAEVEKPVLPIHILPGELNGPEKLDIGDIIRKNMEKQQGPELY